MQLSELLTQLAQTPERVQFNDVMQVIAEHYNYQPCAFQNGALNNEADQNEGSCKLFAFAKLHNLTEQQTLHCFGDYYRVDVLAHPNATDHQNIRNFIQTGWQGIDYSSTPLAAK